MPAVKWFALYAAVSLSLNFVMQITCFVAAMSIDEQRRTQPLWYIISGKTAQIRQDDTSNYSSDLGMLTSPSYMQMNIIRKYTPHL